MGDQVGRCATTLVRGAYSPLYSSPQQRRGDVPDTRDDVYSLGVIWYQLLIGDLSLGAPSGLAWYEELRGRGMSKAQIELLASCFEERQENRPADGKELAGRLRAILTPESVRIEKPVVLPPEQGTGAGRSALRAVMNMVIFCALSGGLVGYFGGYQAPTTLMEGAADLAKLGALAGAGIGFVVGFVLALVNRSGLVAAILGCLFAAAFVAILGGVGGAIIYYTGGWRGGSRAALLGVLGGAVVGGLYSFVTYRLKRGLLAKT